MSEIPPNLRNVDPRDPVANIRAGAALDTDVAAQIGLGGSTPQTVNVRPSFSPGLPTVDDVLGAQPTVDEILGTDPEQAKAAAKAAPQEVWDQNRALHLLGQGKAHGWGNLPTGISPGAEAWLKDVGAYDDYMKGRQRLAEEFNEGLLRPAVVQAEISAAGAFGRGAIRGALPATGGVAGAGAGAELGGAIGTAVEPGLGTAVGGILGGVAGALGGSTAVNAAQTAIERRLPDWALRFLGQLPEQERADITSHPIASFAGELAPNLAFFSPLAATEAASEPAQTIVGRLLQHPLAQRFVPAAVMAGQEAGREVYEGEPLSPGKIGVSAVGGAIMGRPTAAGRFLLGGGAALADQLAHAIDLETLPSPSPQQQAAMGAARRLLSPTGVDLDTEGRPVGRTVSREPFGPQEAFGPPEPAVTGEPVAEPPAPDLHTVARQMAPDLFREYDGIEEQQTAIRAMLDDLSSRRDQGTSPAIEALDLRLQTARLAERYNPRLRTDIAAMEAERQRLADELPTTGDTPEMAMLRKQMLDLDIQRRDLAPQVGAAYRQAAGLPEAPTELGGAIQQALHESISEVMARPENAAFRAPETEQPAPAPQEAAGVPVEPQASGVPRQPEAPAARPAALVPGGIADHVSQQLVAAGRPPEEADAAGALVAAHYEARAANLTGATADQLYADEAPRVIAGRGAQRQLELAQRGELEQPRRGKIRLGDPETEARATITLFKDADASTFIHETGHQWLEELMHDAGDARATDQVRTDAGAVRDWLGVNEGEEIPRRAHEKFARGFERYMMEGHAPSQALASVFAKFKDWLTRIYQTVAALRSPINDDIRGVFDRMLATPERETVIAPGEREPASTFADIHEADAEHTPPERAPETATAIRSERDIVTAPEVESGATEPIRERERAEDIAGRSAGGGGGVGEAGATAGRAEQPPGSIPELRPISESGGEATPEGHRLAERPTEPSEPGGQRPGERAAGHPAGGLIDKAGNIRLDNLNTPEDVNAVIRDIAEANGEFLTARRGVISDGEVMRLAEAMGLRPQDLDIARLRAEFTPERVMATRKLFVQAATDAQRLAAEAANGAPNAIMAYAQARSRLRMVQEYLSALTAETGRGLRAFRRIEGIAQARNVADIMGDLTENKGFRELSQEAARVARLDDPAKVSGFVADADKPGLGAMLEEMFVNWLISGPLTHMGYAVGNASLALWHAAIEAPAQALVGAAAHLAGEEDRIRFGEAGAQLYALVKGQRDGFRAGWSALKAGQTTPLPGEETARTLFTRRQAIPNFNVGGVPVPLGSAVRAPGERMIAPIHSYFRAVNYEAGIARAAYRAAANEGLTGAAFDARVADLTVHPTEDMMAAARGEATQMTLMGRGGGLTQRVSQLMNYEFPLPRPIGPTRLLRFIDPFVTISSNIMEQAILERTPLGFLAKSIRDDLLGKNGPIAQQTAGGRMLAGTALGIVAAGLAAEGALVGSAPSDPKQASVWRRIFGMPHSVRIGDMSYDLSRLGVLGFQLDVATDLYYLAAPNLGLPHPAHPEEKPLGFTQSAELFVKSVAQNFLDEGFMRGPSELMQALDDPDRYGARFVQNFITSLAVPYSVGMAQVAHQVDPDVRQARGIVDGMIAKIPWWSETLLPRRDIWGEPLPSRSWAGVWEQQVKPDPVDETLSRLGYYPSMPQRSISGVQLTPQQYDDYVRIAGRYTHMRLANIVLRPGFAAMPPIRQEEIIRKEIAAGRNAARAQIRLESHGAGNDITAKANAATRAAIQGAPLADVKQMRAASP